jgi:hypothetical protein
MAFLENIRLDLMIKPKGIIKTTTPAALMLRSLDFSPAKKVLELYQGILLNSTEICKIWQV